MAPPPLDHRHMHIAFIQHHGGPHADQAGDRQQQLQRFDPRQRIQSLTYVELGNGNGGIALNVSEGPGGSAPPGAPRSGWAHGLGTDTSRAAGHAVPCISQS